MQTANLKVVKQIWKDRQKNKKGIKRLKKGKDESKIDY